MSTTPTAMTPRTPIEELALMGWRIEPSEMDAGERYNPSSRTIQFPAAAWDDDAGIYYLAMHAAGHVFLGHFKGDLQRLTNQHCDEAEGYVALWKDEVDWVDLASQPAPAERRCRLMGFGRDEWIRTLHNRGVSVAEIAREIRWSASTVRNVLRKTI